MYVICKTDAMQQPYLYTLKVSLGAWSLNTLLPVHAIGWTTGSPPDSLHSGPSIEWASFLHISTPHQGGRHVSTWESKMGKHRFCLSTWVPCHHFAHPYLAFLPYCQSASPLVMLSSTLDAETTACLSIPISLYNHARTSFITNPLFYSIHRSHSSLIKPVIRYGCESWTTKKAEHRRIEAFELWCWRRLLRVPWTARRSNQSILREISPGCSLEGVMLKLKLQSFGHLMRRADSLKRPWC